VLAIYAAEVVPEQKGPDKAAQRIAQLGEWWAGKTLEDVTGKTCRAYRDFRTAQAWKSAKPEKTGNTPRQVSGAGVRRELEDLRAAINYHRKEGYHRETIEVWLPPRGAKRERWLTRTEAGKLLRVMWRAREVQVHHRGRRKGEAVPTRKRIWRHLCRWLLIALYTGSRAEVVSAASFKRGPGRAYIDLASGTFQRRPTGETESVNKLKPTVPLPGRLLAHLRRWHRLGTADWVVTHDGEPARQVNKAFAKAVGAACLEAGVTPHIMRHTLATWLMLLGCDLREAAWYLGMSEKMLESRYSHFHPAFQADIRAKLDGRQAEVVKERPIATVFSSHNKYRKRAA
jgi:integrase